MLVKRVAQPKPSEDADNKASYTLQKTESPEESREEAQVKKRV